MEKEKASYLSVDEYIHSFPDPTQKKLKELRNVIMEMLPEVREKIGYQMPAYSLNGILVYFAGYSKHIGFYPGVTAIEAFKNELSGYKTRRGTIRFPLDKPLPIELIKKIVNFKVDENLKKKMKWKSVNFHCLLFRLWQKKSAFTEQWKQIQNEKSKISSFEKFKFRVTYLNRF